ncbi:hypothetical protein C5167_025927 [Papaver somniferum]|uniref:Uncharacterized protein n=1 Tax=Papaver somniferum TaxID=3469 RepID=A0A4Y7JST3_PAPSO|nr:uncharacterized protein At2g39795, mitochondrial-like [Papaver somniferum]RZC64164.1 hypothetical protein C5167_025927 [Papaver somniferum]
MRTSMNRLIRASQETCLHYWSISSKTAVSRLQRPLCGDIQKPLFNSFFQTRTYSETPKSVFEGNILGILRNEIQYESDYAPPKEPVTTLGPFTVEDRPGEQWIRLRRKYGEEDIQIESTMFDGICPAPKNSDDDADRNMQLRISSIVSISKGENDSVLQFVCFAWPDRLEIQNVFVLRRDGTVVKRYAGQNFKDLEDKLQSSLQEFLDVRGVSEELAVSLHEYMKNKDKIELIRWMGNARSFIEK